jgi:dTDP-glucose pyrophosphorylase
MSSDWRDSILQKATTVLEAIAAVDQTRHKVAVVVDVEGRLLGMITDGDIRRGILAGVPLDGPVTEIMNARPRFGSINDSKEFLISVMRSLNLRHLPVIDYDNRVVGLESLVEADLVDALPNPVLLMAGGQGMRLRPLTVEEPKPMVKVGERPMLETVILELYTQGFRDFFLSVRYLAEKVREYFRNGEHLGVKIEYIEESESLGTAGALGLMMPTGPHPIVVANCDVLTKLDFRQLLKQHRSSGADATMCVTEYVVRLPDGVVEVDGWELVALHEKPDSRHLVNAGVYVFEPSVLPLVPGGRSFDMPELFSILLASGRRAGVFPIREYWADIGRESDLKRVEREFDRHFPRAQDPEPR